MVEPEATAASPPRGPSAGGDPGSGGAAAGADPDQGAAELGAYVGAEVVLDTATPLVFVGRLERLGAHFFVLRDADVHDVSTGGATKERYVLETRKHGVRKNRDEVMVGRAQVVSLSRLEDVTVY